MALDILPYPVAVSVRLAPVELRYVPLFCFALLTAACALASFAFACATPFAAFAVFAAAMLPLRPALLVVTAAWLVNQAIGFGLLHYPIDTNTILWRRSQARRQISAVSWFSSSERRHRTDKDASPEGVGK